MTFSLKISSKGHKIFISVFTLEMAVLANLSVLEQLLHSLYTVGISVSTVLLCLKEWSIRWSATEYSSCFVFFMKLWGLLYSILEIVSLSYMLPWNRRATWIQIQTRVMIAYIGVGVGGGVRVGADHDEEIATKAYCCTIIVEVWEAL